MKTIVLTTAILVLSGNIASASSLKFEVNCKTPPQILRDRSGAVNSKVTGTLITSERHKRGRYILLGSIRVTAEKVGVRSPDKDIIDKTIRVKAVLDTSPMLTMTMEPLDGKDRIETIYLNFDENDPNSPISNVELIGGRVLSPYCGELSN